MDKTISYRQIRLNLTVTEAEEEEINNSYGRYILAGGKGSRNQWLKRMILEGIGYETE